MKRYTKQIFILLLLFCAPTTSRAAFNVLGDALQGIARAADKVNKNYQDSKQQAKEKIEKKGAIIDTLTTLNPGSIKDINSCWILAKTLGVDNSFELDTDIANLTISFPTQHQGQRSVKLADLHNIHWFNPNFDQTSAKAFVEAVKAAASPLKIKFDADRQREIDAEKASSEAQRDIAKNALKGGIDAISAGFVEDAKGAAAGKNQQQMFNLIMQKASDPYFVAGAIGATIVTVGGAKVAYDGAQLLIQRVKDMLEQPDIIKESTLPKTPLDTLKRILFDRQQQPSRLDEFRAPNEELKEALPDIINEIRNSHEAHVDLPNLLFYGPPGTGKTMFAEILAKETGKEYIFLTGSSFALCTEAQAVQNIRDMAAYVRLLPEGGIIFIDEAEIVFADRTYPGTSSLAKAITNEFLAQFPKPSDPKLMFIFCSNNAGVLDVAINSRISKSLQFILPSFEAKLEMLSGYLQKADLVVDEASINRLYDIKKEFEGLSGRDIEDITKDIARAVNANGKELNYELLTKAIKTKRNKIIFTQGERDKFQQASFGHRIDSITLPTTAAPAA